MNVKQQASQHVPDLPSASKHTAPDERIGARSTLAMTQFWQLGANAAALMHVGQSVAGAWLSSERKQTPAWASDGLAAGWQSVGCLSRSQFLATLREIGRFWVVQALEARTEGQLCIA